MSQEKQFLKDLSKHSDAVKKCTRPLVPLGVSCFYYLSIQNNGDHVLLTDCPEVDDYYYDEKLYVKDPYLRHPDNYQAGFFFFESNHKEEFDESLAYIVHKFRMSPLIGLCEKQKDSVEFFGFWGEAEKSQPFEQIYLNYTNLLKAFASHFKDECLNSKQPETLPSLSLPKLIGAEAFACTATRQPKIDADLLRSCLREMGFENEVSKADSLSQREKECVNLLIKGKSMKETASILGLSPRTVEHYLEDVKMKFDCRYKNEIFALAERLLEFGLL